MKSADNFARGVIMYLYISKNAVAKEQGPLGISRRFGHLFHNNNWKNKVHTANAALGIIWVIWNSADGQTGPLLDMKRRIGLARILWSSHEMVTDETDRPTDRPSYRDARTVACIMTPSAL